MRIKKLKMCAFGPYKDLVSIDFEKLGNSGIFLITGDTGSGKTTIFDAISFCLFGVSSGSRRSGSNLRSDFADDAIKTFIELEFVHKNVLYKIKRVPRYVRNKVRGVGTTSVGGDASLIYFDKVITGDKNVSDKCIEILGINASQFKQIVMIAQGEFMDLLLSKSKDRASIFRKIFDTNIYKDMSDKLKEIYLSKRREYEDIMIILTNLKNNIIWEKVIDADTNFFELIKMLAYYNEETVEKEKKLKEYKEKLSKEYELLVKSISEGSLINDSIVSLENAKKRFEELDRENVIYEEKKNLVKKNRDIIEYVLSNYNEINRLKKILKKKDDEYNDSLDKVNKINLKYEQINFKYKEVYKLNEKLDNLRKEKLIYENKLINLREISNLKISLEEKKDLLELINLKDKKILIIKFEDLRNLNNRLDSLENKFENLKLVYQEKNSNYANSYESFLNTQAGIIASKLMDNSPCPVCGSLVHPCPAIIMDCVLTKEDIEKQKDELDKISIDLEELVMDINNVRKDIEVLTRELVRYDYDKLKKEVKKILKKFGSNEVDVKEVNSEEIGRDIINIESLIKDKESSLDNVDNIDFILGKLNDFDININDILNEIEEIKESYQILSIKREKYNTINLNLENEINDLNNELNVCNERYILSYKELGYETEDEYLRIKLDKEEIDKMERDIALYKEKTMELKGNINSLEKFLKNKSVIDIDKLMEKKRVLEDKVKDYDVSLKEINHKLVNNLKIYNDITNFYNEFTKIEKDVVIYKDLSDTANGTINGKNKLEFEQFVQATYFDKVIVLANKRFSYMTDERFFLVRREESSKVSDKLGLELEVIDNYTGRRRDVSSLSGGESFKAALALALGMSDAIQEFSGGIVIDSMFIDEGFGSLDDDSLESALNAIMVLGQSNKIIGIISHINELKNKIDKKIIIKKSSVGSSVELSI